jgi:hypothetical protein
VNIGPIRFRPGRDSRRPTSRRAQVRIEPVMRTFSIFALALISMAFTACTTEQRSPDEIRRQTASATSAATRDAKAVAEGVVDGLRHGSTVNINKASVKDLESLPGIDEAAANRIIDNRPYDATGDLVKKHVISKSEYDHIAEKVTAR